MMLSRFLPAFIKRPIAAGIRAALTGDSRAQPPLYFPSHPGELGYGIRPGHPTASSAADGGLPVPPEELRLDYGKDVQAYLSSGMRHVTTMARIVEEHGSPLRDARRILDFGCHSGRMLRHLPQLAPDAELWGVDVSAPHICWCIENLSPAIHFATTTTLPHLPFEDRYFDLIYSVSVFTHIEDLQEAWLLELGRILRPEGKLYVTILDENTVRLIETEHRDYWLARVMREQPVYLSHKDSFKMIVSWRRAEPRVFYDSRYFRSRVPPIYRWLSRATEAYNYQSAVVLERIGTPRVP